ncbi:MAG: hypothetical protein LC808_11535 [Actinobacteria bacterium]|nr:hypothetical protein [Actinomycetota bacterium]
MLLRQRYGIALEATLSFAEQRDSFVARGAARGIDPRLTLAVGAKCRIRFSSWVRVQLAWLRSARARD